MYSIGQFPFPSQPNPVSNRELPPLPLSEGDNRSPLPNSPEKSAAEAVKLRKKPTPPQVLPYKRRSYSPDFQPGKCRNDNL